ncbi:MAE_28990/MAE_18760 family HEPN-like nuclease [Amycolatopsis sp. lyj-84]|uniref:MAE_28990/MAE_18760 family HEPN-like nuclease n=1 Tax=Amycolatopsis sp. lyj-84 TaxID=2789284 RepID=UPI0039781E01
MDIEAFANKVHGSLARRKRELTSIRLKIQESSLDPRHIDWISRSAILFAYAHWEGFVKEASAKYLKLIVARKLKVGDLSVELQAACLISCFKRASGSEKVRYLASILTEMDSKRTELFTVTPEKVINTESNLSSVVFQDLLLGLGLSYHAIYETRQAFMDEKLLAGRNQVAHGELVAFKAEEALERIDGVLLLLDSYADQLIDAVRDEKFLLQR